MARNMQIICKSCSWCPCPRQFNIKCPVCCEKTSCTPSANAMVMYMSVLCAALCSILARACSVLRFSLMFSYVCCGCITEYPVALQSYLNEEIFFVHGTKYGNVNTFLQYVDIETFPMINTVHYLICNDVHQ